MKPLTFVGFRRAAAVSVAVMMMALSAIGCNIQYTNEDFKLVIAPDGSGELAITIKNIGSVNSESHLRQKDLRELQDAARGDESVKEAAAKGVALKQRRLEFVDYRLDGYVEAGAKKYRDLFEVFTNYSLEMDDRIYLIPLNGSVARAELSEGGEIVVRNGRYAFAWPLESKTLSFTAAYKVRGTPFSYEYQRQFKKR